MHQVSLVVALLVAIAIILVGSLYLANPRTATRSFGLPLPDEDPNTLWWLRLKCSRDVVSGLIVLAIMIWGTLRLVGIILVIAANIPAVDMSPVLAAKGSISRALYVHGLTAALMLLAAVPLVSGIA